MSDQPKPGIKEIAEKACGRQIANGTFEGLLDNITRACEEWGDAVIKLGLKTGAFGNALTELRADYEKQLQQLSQQLEQAKEFLRRYQQRYHGAPHAKKRWQEVDDFIRGLEGRMFP